jgi:hypothetical protein
LSLPWYRSVKEVHSLFHLLAFIFLSEWEHDLGDSAMQRESEEKVSESISGERKVPLIDNRMKMEIRE